MPCDGHHQVVECEALLVATGRKPNVNNVGLNKAGVEYNAKDGVKVNDQLQTTNKVTNSHSSAANNVPPTTCRRTQQGVGA